MRSGCLPNHQAARSRSARRSSAMRNTSLVPPDLTCSGLPREWCSPVAPSQEIRHRFVHAGREVEVLQVRFAGTHTAAGRALPTLEPPNGGTARGESTRMLVVLGFTSYASNLQICVKCHDDLLKIVMNDGW